MIFEFPLNSNPLIEDNKPYLLFNIINPINHKSIKYWCLIDTGADTGLMPEFVVRLTGHDLKADGVKSSINQGVEGKNTLTWRHTFILQLLHPQNSEIVIWDSGIILIDCIDHDNCPPLLGYDDFLKNFKITFDYKTNRIFLEI